MYPVPALPTQVGYRARPMYTVPALPTHVEVVGDVVRVVCLHRCIPGQYMWDARAIYLTNTTQARTEHPQAMRHEACGMRHVTLLTGREFAFEQVLHCVPACRGRVHARLCAFGLVGMPAWRTGYRISHKGN